MWIILVLVRKIPEDGPTQYRSGRIEPVSLVPQSILVHLFENTFEVIHLTNFCVRTLSCGDEIC